MSSPSVESARLVRGCPLTSLRRIPAMSSGRRSRNRRPALEGVAAVGLPRGERASKQDCPTKTPLPASKVPSMTATAATDVTDEQLVALAAGGDTGAFNQLVVRWERPIFALAYRTLGREEDARDVCQEAFLRAFRAIGGFKGQARFSSWLYRIALNLCRDWIRKERRVRVVPASDDLQQEQAHSLEPAEESVEELIVRRDLGRVVERVMATLPEPQRTAILLKEYHGLTFQEIADLQGCPLSTVKTRLYQGLSALRRQLERNGLSMAASLQERGTVSYPPPAGD